jgi:hypothetical protein
LGTWNGGVVLDGRGGEVWYIHSPDTALTKIWIVSSASDGDEALDEMLETLFERMLAEFEG